MNVSESIRLKRAVRSFTDQSLSAGTILAILNAGRRAQSSKNTQPWQFIAVTDRSILKDLARAALLSEAPTENSNDSSTWVRRRPRFHKKINEP